MNRDKVRIRFRKAGDLRFLSHHDLMRAFERMLRRAALPFRSTEGFHPKPKMAFASALGLGIIGHQEVVEIEFKQPLPLEEIHRRLAEQALPGLEILSVQRVDPRGTAQVRRACYRLAFDIRQYPDLCQRIANLLSREECWVERDKPQVRRIDIRPYLLGVELDEGGLTMELAVTPQGSARPEEVLRLLGLEHLLTEGAVLERTLLELHDEPPTSMVRSP